MGESPVAASSWVVFTALRSYRLTPSHMHLTLTARREALVPAHAALRAFLSQHDLKEERFFQIELVTEEVLMNIVWHATSAGETAEMTLDAFFEARTLVLEFGDSGPPFDPTQAPAVQLPTDLDNASPGGLGRVLVKKFAGALAYRREDGRNLLTVRFPG